MLGSSKKKMHHSCHCQQCQHANGTDTARLYYKLEEKSLRQQTKQELRKAIRDLPRDLDEIDPPTDRPGLRLG